MELGTVGRCPSRGRLMAAVTHVCTIDDVAKMVGEDVELLEAIAYNYRQPDIRECYKRLRRPRRNDHSPDR